MDFLKTLMLYMSLTFATSVQSAPTPEVTPVPTPAPTAIVQPAQQEEGAQLTPAGTATATATVKPAPEMTPNKRYSNLKQGSRGDKVRQLQERLIELGYLAEGSADGVYGGQTRKAVTKFQQVNGLGSDGVAGDATQTWLFENPAVLPNPDRPTATPAPTATPTPAQAPVEPTAEATLALPEVLPSPALLEQALIVLNDDGEPLSCLRQQDGVTVASAPRVWQTEEDLLLCLEDLALAIEDWQLAQDASGAYTLTAAGYTVVLTPQQEGYTCTVDGEALALESYDVQALKDGELAVTPAFLAMSLSAEIEWDEEEATLMIRLQHKSVTQATD